MINNSHDLLVYISQNNGTLCLSDDTAQTLGIDADSLKLYVRELELNGYVSRYIRSIGITPDGTKYLKS